MLLVCGSVEARLQRCGVLIRRVVPVLCLSGNGKDTVSRMFQICRSASAP